MTVILDNVTIPEKGVLQLKVDRTVEINVTAEQARKQVNHWLMDQVSARAGAREPTLVILGEQALWRVPAWITFTGHRWEGVIGTVEVDVKTGEMLDLERQKAVITDYLETKVKPMLAPYQPQTREVPADYVAQDVPRGQKMLITKDNEIKPAE